MDPRSTEVQQVVASAVLVANQARDEARRRSPRAQNLQLNQLGRPSTSHLLPTEEQKCKTEAGISVLGWMLNVELGSPASSRMAKKLDLRMQELRTETEHRKTIISPIQKLSFDPLAIIFAWSNRIDWISSMRIAAVSKFWRQTILATPEAWTSFDLQNRRLQVLREMYIRRSSRLSLHLSRRATLGTESTFQIGKTLLFSDVMCRVQCALLGSTSIIPYAFIFPRLVFLSLGAITLISEQRLFPLVNAQMPVLRIVRVAGPVYIDFAKLGTESERQSWCLALPAVERLTLSDFDRSWSENFAGLSQTLTSLELTVVRRPTSVLKVRLPVLRHLRIKYAGSLASTVARRFDLETPTLASYIQEVGTCQLLHQDLASVTHLRMDNGSDTENTVVKLGHCPRLQVLQVGIVDPKAVIRTMFRDPNSHPDLVEVQTRHLWSRNSKFNTPRIERGQIDMLRTIMRLYRLNDARKQQVSLVLFANKWNEDFPEEQGNSCGEHLPCHRGL